MLSSECRDQEGMAERGISQRVLSQYTRQREEQTYLNYEPPIASVNLT